MPFSSHDVSSSVSEFEFFFFFTAKTIIIEMTINVIAADTATIIDSAILESALFSLFIELIKAFWFVVNASKSERKESISNFRICCF